VGYADLLFAWIDRPDCHGTAVEIGHALALGVGVAVGYPDDGRAEPAWFLGQAAALQDAGRVFTGKFPGPIEAFRELVLLRLGWFRQRATKRHGF
jgi:nucleoside 2-deoxyribosyltransferase